MSKRKRFRYIFNGLVVGYNPISNFRLIAPKNAGKKYLNKVALKVYIPDNLKLEKWSYDPYSTTEDERTLDELGYDLLIWNGHSWIVHNEYKGQEPHSIEHYKYTLELLDKEILSV